MATRAKPPADTLPDDEWRQPVQLVQQLQQLPDDLPEDDEPESSTDRVQAMLSEAGGDASAKIVLYRMPVGGKKLTWLDEMTPDTFEAGGLKMIRDKWGAGEYELRLYGQRPESGKYGIRTRTQITLEASREVLPGLPTAAGGSELAQVLRTMMEQQAALLEAVTRRPDPVDPMASMMQQLTLMKAMREAFGDTGGSRRSDIGELVAAMRELKEVSQEFNPDGAAPREPSLLEVAAPLLQGIMASMAQAKGGAPAAYQMQPQPMQPAVDVDAPAQIAHQGVQAAPVIPNPQPTEDEMRLAAIAALKGHLTALLALAMAGKPAEEGSDYLLDHFEDEWLQFLEDTPGWFDLLSKMEPQVLPFETWFRSARDEALRVWNLPE
jgi:hypothetical protein